MATIDNKHVLKIRRLYESGLSMQRIAFDFDVPLGAVVYFFRRNKIRRRDKSAANRASFETKAPTFKIKRELNSGEKRLHDAGVCLYWAEGSKTITSKTVDLANSDVRMVLIFLRFLREICGIDEKKLRVYLYCHSNKELKGLMKFWSNKAGIALNQFTKPYVKKAVSTNGRKMPYGLIHIRYHDKKLLDFLLVSIEKFSKEMGR